MNASYTTLAPGGISDGGVARTVEATEWIWVDTDADGTVLGVEVIGDGPKALRFTDGVLPCTGTGRGTEGGPDVGDPRGFQRHQSAETSFADWP